MNGTTSTQSDRETLSALLDGELAGDARHFALRRLAHDPDWRRVAARWQVAGEVLRGEAVEPAPAGFADRVAAAVAEEPGAMAVAAPLAARRARRAGRARWVGGAALAASVAMVALFAVRTPLEPAAEGDALATGDTGVELMPAPVPAEPAPAGEPGDGVPAALAATAPLAVAALEAGRRDEPRRSRGQQQRAALRASRERDPALQVASVAAPVRNAPAQLADAGPAAEPAPALPFAPADEIASRPWPRALPTLPGRGAFTAGFDTGPQTAAPSFYPFEPRLSPELRDRMHMAPAPPDEQWRRH